jgi:hypothetical protein
MFPLFLSDFNRTWNFLDVEFHDKIIFEISASSWFYYKEICYDARLYERKKKGSEVSVSLSKND